MPKRDDLIHQIFEGEPADASRGAEARMWNAVKADLKAMKDQAPECQVTFDHLEGRLYADTVRTQPRSFWVPAAAAGCLVLGAAYVFGLQMGRQNSVASTVAMANPVAEGPQAGADLRTAEISELIPAPQPQAPMSEPVVSEAPAAPVAAVPVAPPQAAKPAARPAARRKSAAKAVAPAPKAAVASAPVASQTQQPTEGQIAAEPALARGGGGPAGAPAAASAAMAAAPLNSDEMDAAPAVVVVPSIPRGRSGAPVAIENPVMSDIVFGG